LPVTAARAQGKALRRGVSLAGPEFGVEKAGFSCQSPGRAGRDYTYNSEATVEYFAKQGVRLLRIPFRWERIQPKLGADLDARELNRLQEAVKWAKKHDCEVILDVHNYARYTVVLNGKPFSCVIDQVVGGKVPVSRDHFADLWRRLAVAFRNEPTVAAYGLMNEPHEMGRSDWKAISQAAVDAIRKVKDKHRLLVCGDGWSSAHRFEENNGGKAWIKDPAKNTLYEAHCYFDKDNSGKYADSYKDELKKDPKLPQRPLDRLRPFVRWCEKNKVRGFLGEFGAPGDDESWLKLLSTFMKALDKAEIEGCYWAAGEWWGQYRLSLQPSANYTKHAPQLAVLKGGKG
jgi:endoglucanase